MAQQKRPPSRSGQRPKKPSTSRPSQPPTRSSASAGRRRPAPSPQQQDEDESFGNLIVFVGLVIGLPVVLVILMAVTPLGDTVRDALGYSLEQDANFVIYDVTCRTEGRFSSANLNVTYYTADPAPVGILYGGQWYQIISIPSGGLYTADIILAWETECPDTITMGDISRNRRSEALVEKIES